jgi:hypothetical protein
MMWTRVIRQWDDLGWPAAGVGIGASSVVASDVSTFERAMWASDVGERCGRAMWASDVGERCGGAMRVARTRRIWVR